MVEQLVADVLTCPEVGQVIVTRNIPESLTLPQDVRILVIDNTASAGFAANQNAAFRFCALPYFCPLNPDIQLQGNPFPSLLSALQEVDDAIVAPLVRNPLGDAEDSIRFFPTITSLLSKALGWTDGHYNLKNYQSVFYPEWVAGMFMLFRSSAYKELNGFDERFFLYYEDVDICARAWKAGLKVLACPSVSVVHDARRDSHKNLKYLRWHLTSIIRYFWKHCGRLPTLPNHG